jgi:putative NADPH-quinone reductase
MSRRIAIIQGHPDPAGGHLGHALAEAYAQAARQAGHEVRTIDVAHLDFPVLRTQAEWKSGPPPDTLLPANATIMWAEHIAIFFPLWLGTMPALFKAFLEQVLRPGWGVPAMDGKGSKRPLAGKSARLVVTMGMPALVYRWVFRAHGIRGLERGILGFVGVAPVRETLIGMVEGSRARIEQKWLPKMRVLGRDGA